MVRGSCLCGGLRFEVDGKVSDIGMCHCSLCRKASGVGSNAVLLTSVKSFRWLAGKAQVRSWSRPGGWTSAFCETCGAPAPLLHPSGKVYWVPAGLLDDDPGVGVGRHIFVGSKAPWDEIAGRAPQHEEGAPG